MSTKSKSEKAISISTILFDFAATADVASRSSLNLKTILRDIGEMALGKIL